MGSARCRAAQTSNAENAFMRTLDVFGTARAPVTLAAATEQLTLTCASTAHAQDSGVTPSEVSIGAIGALTGPLAFIGTPGRDSMTVAFNEINANGGVCGRTLHLGFG